MSLFTPSQPELALVSLIFAKADPQKLGIVTGDAAVKVLAGSKLPPTTLGEVWSIADKENNGFLTRKGVAIALRLIGHAQKGEAVSETLINKPGPVAHIEGVSKHPPTTSSVPSSPAPTSSPPKSTPQLPPLTLQDKNKFARLFAGCGPVNGLLSGDQARDVFIKSKLPFEKLSQIWNLADGQSRGSLDQTDFTIAMYLIQASMSGQLPVIPPTLAPGLYEQIRSSQGVASHGTGTSGSISPGFTSSFNVSSPSATLVTHGTGQAHPLIPQSTGQAFNTSFFPARPSVNTSSVFGTGAFPAAQSWDVTAEEKVHSDRLFDRLDTQRKGYIEGDIAVPFMLQSKLSEEALAQVWDLADLHNDGRLTRDGFAVAMHLIQGKLAGKDIPSTIPESLIPPSMRNNDVKPIPASVPEPVRDLLWDDSPPSSAVATQSTGTHVLQPQTTGPSTAFQRQVTGQLSQHHTGSFSARAISPASVAQAAPIPSTFGGSALPSSFHKDLLSDDEETAAASSPVPDHSVELGNVQNQLNSTNRSLDKAKTERQNTEQTLANQASQLSAFQTQLSSAKAAYETETRLLSTLRERFAEQAADIQKAKEEIIRAESDLSAVKEEKSEVGGALLRDKDEVRELQRKMKEVGEEVEQVKAQVEKAKKEAKQQKGLLAIARKQLSTREAEKAKIAKELAEAEAELESATREREAAEAELSAELESTKTNGVAHSLNSPPRTDTPAIAAAQPLPASPSVGSAVTSPTGKSNNPFERLAFVSGTSTPRAASPFQPLASTSTSAAIVDNQTANDPFGLYEFVEKPNVDDATFATPAAEKPSTARQADTLLNDVASPVSLDQNESAFRTPPPNTSTPLTTTELDESKRDFNSPFSVEAAASHFPDIEPHTLGPFAPSQDNPHTETDLGTQLKEIEHHSDSGSDSDVEFQDANGRLSLFKARESEDSAHPPDTTGSVKDASTENGIAPLSFTPLTGTFDDVFGHATPVVSHATLSNPSIKSSSPQESGRTSPQHSLSINAVRPSSPQNPVPEVPSQGEVQSSTPFEPPADKYLPPPTIESVLEPNEQSTQSGINDFDEALGIMPSKGSDTQPPFTFDAAFEDNFDFTAAGSGNTFEPTLASSQPTFPPPLAVNGTASVSRTQNTGFDNIFSVPETTNTPSSAATPQTGPTMATEDKTLSFDDAFGPTPSHTETASNKNISFEDAFGSSNGAPKVLALDDTFQGQRHSLATSPPEPEASYATSGATSFPTVSPSASPTRAIGSSPGVERSSSPPPRQASPPPRVSSPKPRLSTASSKEVSIQDKPHPTRHSKLSIRLPFGRKDKDKKKSKHELPPVPPAPAQASTHLAPVPEPSSALSPAVDDDVEPVKLLCGMGFSRAQAVTALEIHGYDVQKALNDLLGTL